MAIAGDQLDTGQRLLAGACAGIASVVCTYPLDVLRTKLSLGERGSVSKCIRSTFEAGGIRAFYRGLFPTVVGIAPYVALSFTVYESLRQSLFDPDRPSTFIKLACGGLAGAVAQTCTYPLDVIRRRMQVSRQSISNTIRSIFREHRWCGFYYGIWPNYLKVVPSISISFVVYEAIMPTKYKAS